MDRSLISLLLLVAITCLFSELSATSDICMPKTDGGPCGGNLPVWGYDSATKKCTPFVYGGCLGNRNRFITKESCEATCSEKTVCAIESVGGPCPPVRVWGFHPIKHQCVQYEYGGCSGLAHRFRTRRACENICGNFKNK